MNLVNRYKKNQINYYLHIGDIAIITACEEQLENIGLVNFVAPGERIIICSEIQQYIHVFNNIKKNIKDMYYFKTLFYGYNSFNFSIPAAFVKVDKENKLWRI